MLCGKAEEGSGEDQKRSTELNMNFPPRQKPMSNRHLLGWSFRLWRKQTMRLASLVQWQVMSILQL